MRKKTGSTQNPSTITKFFVVSLLTLRLGKIHHKKTKHKTPSIITWNYIANNKLIVFYMKGKIAYLTLISMGLFSCGNKMQLNTGTPEYAVITLSTSSSELEASYPATIKGKQDIEIRPKVSGFITKLCIDEGSTVRKGQPLFIIDPVQYRAQVNAAEAAVKLAEANVATQRLTVKNKKELHDKKFISDTEMEMAENQLKSLEASLAQAKANLTSARDNLAYTTVTSPSDGVVGSIPFRLGSLVSSSTTTPLTTVSDISEMYVYFSLTEKQLLAMTRESKNIEEALKGMPEVSLKLADGSLYNQKGSIETVSGVIDQNTGSVSMRATFPNPGHILRSGGTGIILIPTKTDNAILVPQKATYEIQDKKFVYTVDKNSKVKSTEIKVLSLNDGQNYVVTSGVKAGDRIVVEGVSTLKDGTEIKAITPKQANANFKAGLNADKTNKE